MPDPAGAVDARAEKEATALGNEVDLEKLERARAHKRRESFRDHYHIGMILLFWGFSGVLSIAGAFWAFHLLTPTAWHFLTAAQLGKIESTIFSGVLAAFLSTARRSRYID